MFGYGEERCEIDAALIKDVIADLDATGVLGLLPNPERSASVVPVEPAMAATGEVLGLRQAVPPAEAAPASAPAFAAPCRGAAGGFVRAERWPDQPGDRS